jgi:metal-sulfur cluster biosynthetic enzyme
MTKTVLFNGRRKVVAFGSRRSAVTKGEALEALKNVEDPELTMNIVDLGLVYQVDVDDDAVRVEFTLTTPGCPAGDIIRDRIIEEVRKASGLPTRAELVWNPPWSPEFMSDEARIALGFPV